MKANRVEGTLQDGVQHIHCIISIIMMWIISVISIGYFNWNEWIGIIDIIWYNEIKLLLIDIIDIKRYNACNILKMK